MLRKVKEKLSKINKIHLIFSIISLLVLLAPIAFVIVGIGTRTIEISSRIEIDDPAPGKIMFHLRTNSSYDENSILEVKVYRGGEVIRTFHGKEEEGFFDFTSESELYCSVFIMGMADYTITIDSNLGLDMERSYIRFRNVIPMFIDYYIKTLLPLIMTAFLSMIVFFLINGMSNRLRLKAEKGLFKGKEESKRWEHGLLGLSIFIFCFLILFPNLFLLLVMFVAIKGGPDIFLGSGRFISLFNMLLSMLPLVSIIPLLIGGIMNFRSKNFKFPMRSFMLGLLGPEMAISLYSVYSIYMLAVLPRSLLDNADRFYLAMLVINLVIFGILVMFIRFSLGLEVRKSISDGRARTS